MEALVNKTVRLSGEQIAGLKKEAARRNRKFTELIRIAVDEMLGIGRANRNGSRKR